MDFKYIEYSDFFYQTNHKTATPLERTGKFVQLTNETTEFVVFSPKDYTTYHADILVIFCKQQEIAHTHNAADKYLEIADTGWKIIGGGSWKIDENEKLLVLWGFSQAYGKFNPEGLKEKLATVNVLTGFTIQIDGK
ncbi:MAG: hypothetical protein HQK88_06645 [Nitrospirae bacterium]|nr:hypothetical protein [Nitrospirota bacterium]MBF0534805.1 hypothetical protein [Nitrospirota bacterium]MBF0616479.1 hypothetical protein [Nitrospirota bacterium]